MSELLKLPSGKHDASQPSRKNVKKVVIDDSDDETLSEVGEVCNGHGEGHSRCKKCEGKYEEARPRRRMAAFSVHSLLGNGAQKNFHVTCLLCERKTVRSDANSPTSAHSEAYYICDKCMDGEREQSRNGDCEKERTRELEAALLKSKEKLRSIPLGCTNVDPRDFAHCKCQNCIRRRTLEEERLQEIQMFRSCWDDLKKVVRQMFRDGLHGDMCSSKGKKFDVEKIKRNVAILAEKDPHQLYRRLESIGHEYVMNLKSDDLWQILVAPQVVPALSELAQSGASEQRMELERAKLFIKSLLERFSFQQETVRNMSPLLSALDDQYLSQFGISWKVINHHIFDSVIYQDDLLINYLPSMEKVLKCELIVLDENEKEQAARALREASRTDIPLGALELARRFRVLHKLMVTSREIFRKAEANIAIFAEQQNIIHRITRKAKGELLEEGFEFFKSQRKMMRNCASRKKQFYRWSSTVPLCTGIDTLFDDDDENTDSESDTIDFSKRMHELIEEGPPSSVCFDHNGDVAPCMQCKDCSVKHCSCDECRISHVITCGLLGQDDEISADLIWSKLSAEVEKNKDKEGKAESPRRRRSSCELSERRTHRSFLPSQAGNALFTLHDNHNKKEIAWGEWQVPYNFSKDLDYDMRCLYKGKDLLDNLDGNERTVSFDEMTSFESGDLVERDAFVAAIKDVAEQIGYDIEESVIGKAADQRYRSDAKGTSESSAANRCKGNKGDQPPLSDRENGLSHLDDDRLFCWKSDPRIKANVDSAEDLARFAESKKKRCRKLKKQKARKGSKEMNAEHTDTDSESSSLSLVGTADWSQIRLINDTVFETKCIDGTVDEQQLTDTDKVVFSDVPRQQFAFISKKDTSASGIALELLGNKVMEKPQLAHKSTLTPSVTRIIKKMKNGADKLEIVSNSGSSTCPKPLIASARERLLSEVKEMDRKGKDKASAPKPSDLEKWSAREDFKMLMMESMKDCLAKECSKENEVASLKAVVMAAAHDSDQSLLTGMSKAAVSKAKKPQCDRTTLPKDSPTITRKSNSVSRCDKEEKLTKLRTKQSIATSIAKQLGDSKNFPEIGKVSFSTERKVKTSLVSACCSPSSKTTGGSQKGTSKNVLSTTVDFNVDLNDFDFNSIPAEVAKKLREDGKLDRLIAHAVGVKHSTKSKIAVTGKLEYKCEDGRRTGYCESREELLDCHSDNDIDDVSEDDEEDSDEEWSECDTMDHRHPHRHHSCDSKKKSERTSPNSRRENRHGHCDCCYCEMFGHSAAESTKAGRVPQIRERLRLKLKRRNRVEDKPESESNKRTVSEERQAEEKVGEKPPETQSTVSDSSTRPPVVRDAPIEEILDYINEKDNVAAQSAASRAAKRARQKQRKQEEKERIELERRKLEERRKAEEEEALQRKKEQQAAQQAANREKALKAEGKRRKAAEDRARAQKRQKELREMERQQHAKEQQRANKVSTPRTGASAEDVERKAKSDRNDDKSAVVKSSEFPRTAPEKTQNVEPDVLGASSQATPFNSCSPSIIEQRSPSVSSSVESNPLTVSSPSESSSSPASTSARESLLLLDMPTHSPLPANPLLISNSSTISQLSQPHLLMENQVPRVSYSSAFNLLPKPYTSASSLDDDVDCGCAAATATSYPIISSQAASTSNPCVGGSKTTRTCSPPGLESRLFGAASHIHPCQAQQSYFENTTAPLFPQPGVNVATNISQAPLPIFGTFENLPAETLYRTGATQIETSCSSSSSVSSSLSSSSTHRSLFERTPFIQMANDGCFENTGVVDYGNEMPFFVPQDFLPLAVQADASDVCHLNPKLNQRFADFIPPVADSACNGQSASQSVLSNPPSFPQKKGDMQPGSSQLTAAVRAKRVEARKAFLSTPPRLLASYETETKMLAVASQNEGLFLSRNPMIFEPGDPGIARAIAEMKFDPHEAFKPRPDAELDFLDPLELEIEHFKRVMWEAENSTRLRLPLRELSRIEPENDVNAVFHFAPLV